MKTPLYKWQITLEKGWVMEFSMSRNEAGRLIGSVTPNDNIVKVIVFKWKKKIYDKWVFLKFPTGDVFQIALSIEKRYETSEVFDETEE